jgi:hypothetical protein
MEEFEAILETGGAAAVEVAASALAERGGTTPPCPNCSRPMLGPYCAVCGQPLNTHRRSLGNLLRELVKDIASFDSRILRTGKALLAEPGELPRAFREGRTQRYVPSVRLYLFVSLLFFLFLGATGIALIQFNLAVDTYSFVHDQAGHVYKVQNGKRELIEGMKAGPDGKVIPTEDIPGVDLDIKADGTVKNSLTSNVTFFQRIVHKAPSQVLDKELRQVNANLQVNGENVGWIKEAITGTLTKLRNDPGALNGPLTTWIPRILFVLLPLFAVLLAIFYRKLRKHFFFVDHLVFSLTMHTFVFVVLIGAALAAQVMSGGWVAWLTLIVLSLYLFLSLKYFYAQGWLKTGFKFVGITFIYAVFFIFPALIFALIASVVGGA